MFYQGQIVGHIRKWSDLLLIFYLKRHRPEFRDNYRIDVQHSGKLEIESARDRLAAKLQAALDAAAADVIDVTPQQNQRLTAAPVTPAVPGATPDGEPCEILKDSDDDN